MLKRLDAIMQGDLQPLRRRLEALPPSIEEQERRAAA